MHRWTMFRKGKDSRNFEYTDSHLIVYQLCPTSNTLPPGLFIFNQGWEWVGRTKITYFEKKLLFECLTLWQLYTERSGRFAFRIVEETCQNLSFIFSQWKRNIKTKSKE